jgi:hypothetical protein
MFIWKLVIVVRIFIFIDQKFKGGLYFLTIETETEKFVEKFIVVD